MWRPKIQANSTNVAQYATNWHLISIGTLPHLDGAWVDYIEQSPLSVHPMHTHGSLLAPFDV